MLQVDSNRLKGNYGVAVVVEKLSAHCLVRQVTADTDIGIDLYCETVTDEGQPFLHFWLQVKTGVQCEEDASLEKAKCCFERKHLEYWKRQPVPVFAVLIPTIDWPPKSEPNLYIVDITTHVLTNSISLEQNSYTLTSKYKWSSDDLRAIVDFLTKVVPAVTARLEVSNGVVAKVPTYNTEYIQRVPNVPVVEYKENILEQVRCTAALSIIQLCRFKQLNDDNKAFVSTLARVVDAFAGDPHWENPMALGLAHHLEGKFDEAIGSYEKAISCLQGDPTRNPAFLNMIPEVEMAIRDARAHKPVHELKIHI